MGVSFWEQLAEIQRRELEAARQRMGIRLPEKPKVRGIVKKYVAGMRRFKWKV